MNEILSDEDLIIATENHTKIGAQALYDKYSSSLFKVIYSNVKQQEFAEDILQQTYIKIWNSFEQYHEQKGRLCIWIMGIARKLSKEALHAMTEVKTAVIVL
jgi:DNA-directed RNA polymerase specialized sigma24 family protein